MDDIQLAEWVKNTCLLWGTTVATAYQVAGMFVGALNNEKHDLPDSGPQRFNGGARE